MSVHPVFRDRVATLFTKRLSIDTHTFDYENLYGNEGWERVKRSQPDLDVIGKYLCGELGGHKSVAVLLNRLETNVLVLVFHGAKQKSLEDTREDYLRAIDVMGNVPSIVFMGFPMEFHAYWILDRRVPTAYATHLLQQELARHGLYDVQVRPTHERSLTIPMIRRRADVETLTPIPRSLRSAAIDFQRAVAHRNRIYADSMLGGTLTKGEVFSVEASAPQRAFEAKQKRIELKQAQDANHLTDSIPEEPSPTYDPTHFIRNGDFTQLVRRYVVEAAEILVKKWQMTNPKQRRSVINFICYLFYTEQYRRQEFANPVKAGFRQSANRLYAQNMSNGFIEYPAESMKTVYSYYPDIITRLLREGLLEQKRHNSYSNIHHYAKTYRINHEHKTLEWTRKRDQNRAESYGGIELTYWERVLYEHLQTELGFYEMQKITNRDIVRDPAMKNAGFKAHRVSKTLKNLKKKGLIDIFIRRQQHPGGMRTIRKIEVKMVEDALEERARKPPRRYGSLRAIYEYKKIRKRFSIWAEQLLKRLDGEAAFEIEIAETGGRPKKDILVSEETYRKAVDHYFLFIGDDVPEPQERSK